MRHRILTLIAAAALLSAAGCGSDDDDQAATTTTPAGGEVTTTTPDRIPTTTTTTPATTTDDAGADEELSARARAVLAETQDLAADVSRAAEEFARGSIDEDEAMARLEVAGERADDLRARAEDLPDADRARTELASLNEEISRTTSEVSRLIASGRSAGRDEINQRINELRDEARSTFDSARDQLDERNEKRFREALDRIGIR